MFRTVILSTALTLTVAASSASAEGYVNFDGIKGTSEDSAAASSGRQQNRRVELGLIKN